MALALGALGCAATPNRPSFRPPAWVSGGSADTAERFVAVSRGGPAGIPSHARKIALDRGLRDLARRFATIRVVARYSERSGGSGHEQSAVGDETETLASSLLADVRVEDEWVDRDGRYSGVDGRVYYLLLSIHKGARK